MASATPPRRAARWIILAGVVAALTAAVAGVGWWKLPEWKPEWALRWSPFVAPLIRAELAAFDGAQVPDGTPRLRRRIEEMGPSATPSLRRLTRHPDDRIAAMAFLLLADHGDERGIPDLIHGVTDSRWTRIDPQRIPPVSYLASSPREAALMAILRLPPRAEALAPALALAGQPLPADEKDALIALLRHLGDPAAIPALLPFVAAESGPQRSALSAVEALLSAGDAALACRTWDQAGPDVRPFLVPLCGRQPIDDALAARLVAYGCGPDAPLATQVAVLEALAEGGRTQELHPFLRAEAPRARELAIARLATDATALPQIILRLQDPDERVVRVAAEALAHTTPPPPAEAILPLLDVRAPTTRAAAASIVGWRGMRQAVVRLRELAAGDDGGQAQEEAMLALGRLRDAEAVALLIQKFDARTPMPQLAAVALALIDVPAARAALRARLVAGADRVTWAVAAATLAEKGDPEVVALLATGTELQGGGLVEEGRDILEAERPPPGTAGPP